MQLKMDGLEITVQVESKRFNDENQHHADVAYLSRLLGVKEYTGSDNSAGEELVNVRVYAYRDSFGNLLGINIKRKTK